MMSNSSPANAELAIVLPLGVAANQLLKVEADLRLLGAKAALCAQERGETGIVAQVAARLEQINETLEAIRALIAQMETDLQPKTAGAAFRHRREDRDD
jgi:demethoxyubiquinone hydroxylase (CLK1/Coq7/Cat5 family)